MSVSVCAVKVEISETGVFMQRPAYLLTCVTLLHDKLLEKNVLVCHSGYERERERGRRVMKSMRQEGRTVRKSEKNMEGEEKRDVMMINERERD